MNWVINFHNTKDKLRGFWIKTKSFKLRIEIFKTAYLKKGHKMLRKDKRLLTRLNNYRKIRDYSK